VHGTDAGEIAIEKPALVAALQAMVELLESEDMEAMNAMAQLQQQFGDALTDELATLEQALAELDFARALPACKVLLDKYGAWQEP
jgi:hypothetical protein